MSDKHEAVSAEAFDPVAFAERWYQENPRALHRYFEEFKQMQNKPRNLERMNAYHAKREARLYAVAFNLYKNDLGALCEIFAEWSEFRNALGEGVRKRAIKSFEEVLDILGNEGDS